MPGKVLLQNQLPVGTPELWLYAKFNLAQLQAAAAPSPQPLVLAVLFLCPQGFSRGDFHSDQVLNSSHCSSEFQRQDEEGAEKVANFAFSCLGNTFTVGSA